MVRAWSARGGGPHPSCCSKHQVLGWVWRAWMRQPWSEFLLCLIAGGCEEVPQTSCALKSPHEK